VAYARALRLDYIKRCNYEWYVPCTFIVAPLAAWPLRVRDVLLLNESLRWEPGLLLIESSSPILEGTRESGDMETYGIDTIQTEDRSSEELHVISLVRVNRFSITLTPCCGLHSQPPHIRLGRCTGPEIEERVIRDA
jgi:hypothetical protein